MAISLDGVGAEWEASEYVREYVKGLRDLFLPLLLDPMMLRSR